MAGVKGRSGGPRPNSGGKREGAGRKPDLAPQLPQTDDALEFLKAAMNDAAMPVAQRVRAAIAAAAYQHAKKGESGKRAGAEGAAKVAAAGRFRPAAAPPLKRVA